MDQFNVYPSMFNHQGPPMPHFAFGSQPSTAAAAATVAQGQTTAAPEHIKRPMNMFMVWSQEQRKQITKAHPHKHNAEISQELAAKWKAMSNEEKAPWKAEADRLKMEHQQRYPNYKYQPKRDKKKESPMTKAAQKKAVRPMTSIQNLPDSQHYQGAQMNMGYFHPQMTTPEVQNQMVDPQMMMMQSPGYQFWGNQIPTNPPPMEQNLQMPLQMNSPIPNAYYQNYTNQQQHVPTMFAPINSEDFVRGSSVDSSGFRTSPSTASSTSSRGPTPMGRVFAQI